MLAILVPIYLFDPHFQNFTRAQTDKLILTTLTVFTIALETLQAEARDYGKGRYISDTLEVLGLSQCTGSVCQSEHSELFRSRGFVEISTFQTDLE